MLEATPAAFRFKNFKITDFSYSEPIEDDNELTLKFSPSGILNEQNGEYELTIKFKAFEKNGSKKQIVHLTLIAYFQFTTALRLADMPAFFYKNSIAIAFPYVRSFVSTLTLQANSGSLLLGVMNLANLEVPLREHTKIKSKHGVKSADKFISMSATKKTRTK